MSPKEHLVYWMLPLLVSCILAFMYFAGSRWMQDIVAHSYNREFGLLENLQNVLLIGVVFISFILFRNGTDVTEKAIYLVCLTAAVFMLLEEIDYGFHLWNYHRGIRPAEDPMIHNLHNRGENTIRIMMLASYAIILLFILIMPHVDEERLPSWIVSFVPSMKLHSTLLTIPLISRLPHMLNRMEFETNLSLYHNLSEFEELALYYVFFLFFYELRTRQHQLQSRGELVRAG